VRVCTPRADDLLRHLPAHAVAERTGPHELEVSGVAPAVVGDLAHAVGVPVHHLSEVEQSLEHAYLALTGQQVDPVPEGLAR
jgi:ABC-2 type transport system ATP-binding protein